MAINNSTERRVALEGLMDISGVGVGASGARGLAVDMTSEVCFAYTTDFLRAIPASSGRMALAFDLRPSSSNNAAACAAAIQHARLIVNLRSSCKVSELRCYVEAATQERASFLSRQACLQRLKSERNLESSV